MLYLSLLVALLSFSWLIESNHFLNFILPNSPDSARTIANSCKIGKSIVNACIFLNFWIYTLYSLVVILFVGKGSELRFPVIRTVQVNKTQSTKRGDAPTGRSGQMKMKIYVFTQADKCIAHILIFLLYTGLRLLTDFYDSLVSIRDHFQVVIYPPAVQIDTYFYGI